MRDKVQEQIRQRIIRQGRGKLYVNTDFANLASPDAIRKALQRLSEEGFIIREFRGIYSYPKIDKKYGFGILRPTLWDIAQAIARRDHVRVAPSASVALNKLGLSEQVPMNAVFLTTGSARRVKVGDGKGILFKHSSDNNLFAYKSPLMQLIVLAMRDIGEGKLTSEELGIIQTHIKHVSEKDFAHDIRLAPVWIQEIFHNL